ncbi:uncharacterized protein PHALS_02661 [Plasmopara halstedii]|uniref:Uncharacterized protein n=1 Tax=Plasmopara halstedii TaxID=4781 RepID=A0A0P1AYA6_PLAHL|nr:uncharacterized protein PHALS_02661 [Plasmopara halstedii]CEG46248.1 hypothetical protein PHALS_02661 [Plasmopara halstedii]|eukprot:XP_024582617.1 hypothetical protein PHALS_02661 [Plasmopara halstedii]
MSCTPLRPLYANRASSFSRNTRKLSGMFGVLKLLQMTAPTCDPWCTVFERPSRSSQCRTINPDTIHSRNSQGARLRLSLLPVAVRSTHW